LDSLSADELAARIDGVRVVARATAANKLRLVEALKARGHVVAMTGDGINDAPAIKAASIGVAMGRGGTDVTREAADMVLLDDNYATIVRAIEEGRIVYGNIKRFIVFLFAVNTGLVLAVLYGAAAGWPPILTPTQILWINLITNGLPALALGMEAVHLDPMNQPPRSADERLVSFDEFLWLSGYGALMAVLGIATFAVLHDPAVPGSLTVARTATFTVLALAPLFHAFNSRSRKDSLLKLGIVSNRWLLGAFAFAVGLQAVAVYVGPVQDVFSTTALGAKIAFGVLGVSSLVWVCAELEKALMRLVRKRRERRATH
jgi:Ca2+-transporting ATPase